MPPQPKKKHSTSRKKRKRAHLSAPSAKLILCPQCRSPKVSHHVCHVCGTYNGRDVIAVGEERGG